MKKHRRKLKTLKHAILLNNLFKKVNIKQTLITLNSTNLEYLKDKQEYNKTFHPPKSNIGESI